MMTGADVKRQFSGAIGVLVPYTSARSARHGAGLLAKARDLGMKLPPELADPGADLTPGWSCAS